MSPGVGLLVASAYSASGTITSNQDITTQGNWIGTYGSSGYAIVSGPTSLPPGDTVTPTGQSTYTWTTATTDPRALQVPGSPDRVAAVWYSPTSFSVDVNLGDGLAHDLELYLLDWDNQGRAETVQISDAATGAVLYHAAVASFQSGEYLYYTVSGHIEITITNNGPANAVLNGLFLDPTAAATFVRTDTTTQGTWIGTYGASGYDIVSGPTSLPPGDTVTPTGQSTYTWTTTTTDPRALQVPGSLQPRRRRLVLPHQLQRRRQSQRREAHDLELYLLDWDSKGRAETVQISDAVTGAVLSTQSVASFQAGVYLDYAVSGDIVITITRTAGANAVLNGLFLDGTGTPTFVREDTTTQGNWIGTYGASGYAIVSGPTSLPPATRSRPPASRPTPGPPPPPTPAPCRSLARLTASPPSGTRPPASASTSTSATGRRRTWSCTSLDWDSKGRAETVQISDATTGAVLSTQSISSFQSGVYLDYAVSGHIVITITRTAGANAVLNGLFLG